MRLAASRAVQSSGDVGVAVIESESISGAPATAGGSGHGALRWLPWVVAALALVPLGSMLAMVLGGNEMQWADYWEILPRVTNPDGSFAPRGLFEYQNSHPIAVASAVYWVNAHLTGGSNIALGIFVVAVVAVQVVILVWALPRQVASSPLRRAGFGVAFSALLFATRGVHNFVLAMSGTAWLTANLVVIVTIFVVWRRSPAVAVPFAALASISYGTGLVLWPVLVLMAVIERRSRRGIVGLCLATIVAAALYLSRYEAPRRVDLERTVVELARRACQVLGSPFSDNTEVAGLWGVALLVLAACALWCAWNAGLVRQVAPWVGLLGYTLGSAALIAYARGGLSDEIGVSSRYVSIGALAWASTIVLLSTAVPRRRVVLAGVAGVCAVAFIAGQGTVDQVRDTTYYSDELAIALRLGAVPAEIDYRFDAASAPLLPVLGHYPFNDDFDADCGYLGRRLDTSTPGLLTSAPQVDGFTGALEAFDPSEYDTAVRLHGWYENDRAGPLGDVRCILVIDERGSVIGAAAPGPLRTDLRAQGYVNAVGFQAVARPQPDGGTYRAVAVAAADDPLVLLDGQLATPG